VLRGREGSTPATTVQAVRSTASPRASSTAASVASSQARSLLALQRQAGNRAVTSNLLAVQRHYTDNAEEFVPWITQQPAYTTYSTQSGKEVKEVCHDAARAIGELLSEHDPPIEHVGRVFLTWRPRQRAPMDHVVVVANIAGNRIVVDPTRQQFGRPACVLPENTWRAEFEQIFEKEIGIATQAWDRVPMACTRAEGTANWWDEDELEGREWTVVRAPQSPEEQPPPRHHQEERRGGPAPAPRARGRRPTLREVRDPLGGARRYKPGSNATWKSIAESAVGTSTKPRRSVRGTKRERSNDHTPSGERAPVTHCSASYAGDSSKVLLPPSVQSASVL
jgi:hypothetical protein